MNHFDLALWKQVIGDVLILVCYAGPLFVLKGGSQYSSGKRHRYNDDVVGGAFWLVFGFVGWAVSQCVSAGWVK